MFEPGHLHRANQFASADQPVFSIDLYYEVRQDPVEGAMLHMRMVGERRYPLGAEAWATDQSQHDHAWPW